MMYSWKKENIFLISSWKVSVSIHIWQVHQKFKYSLGRHRQQKRAWRILKEVALMFFCSSSILRSICKLIKIWLRTSWQDTIMKFIYSCKSRDNVWNISKISDHILPKLFQWNTKSLSIIINLLLSCNYMKMASIQMHRQGKESRQLSQNPLDKDLNPTFKVSLIMWN